MPTVIDSLVVQELLDYSSYASTFMLFDIMGFGKKPNEPVPLADPAVGAMAFKAHNSVRVCSGELISTGHQVSKLRQKA